MHSFNMNACGHNSCKKECSIHKGSNAVAMVESELLKVIKVHDEAGVTHESFLQALMESKEALITRSQDEEELQAQYATTMETTTEVKRQGTNVLSLEKMVEAQDMLQRLINMSETQEKVATSIKAIEGDTLALLVKAYECAKIAVAEAED